MDERQLHQRLAALRARTLDSLVRLPGAHAVYLSGSLAGGTGDGYSDIDLQVLTADLPASLAALPAALGAIGAVDVAWELAESRDDWAATILWRGKCGQFVVMADDSVHVSGGVTEDLPERETQGIELYRLPP